MAGGTVGQVLPGGATPTKAIRRAIQHSEESLRTLGPRHGSIRRPAPLDFQSAKLMRRPWSQVLTRIGLVGQINTSWGATAPRSRSVFAASLLDAVWLQAAQHLSSGATVRRCQHCSQWRANPCKRDDAGRSGPAARPALARCYNRGWSTRSVANSITSRLRMVFLDRITDWFYWIRPR